MDEIRVTVVKFPDRKNLMLRYIDPITSKQRYRERWSNKTQRSSEVGRQMGGGVAGRAICRTVPYGLG